jgi:hypothetical protein
MPKNKKYKHYVCYNREVRLSSVKREESHEREREREREREERASMCVVHWMTRNKKRADQGALYKEERDLIPL